MTDKNEQTNGKAELIGVDPLAWLSEEEKAGIEANQGVDKAEHTTLTLPVALTIQESRELMQQLNDINSKYKKLTINAEEVEKIDTSGLQLLLGYSLFAEKEGVSIDWHQPSEALQNAVALLGLQDSLHLAA